MRWIYLAVIILFAAATTIFAAQNFEIVTMTFLGFNARVPLALLVAVAYVLGAATGGSLWRSGFLPSEHQGTHFNQSEVDPEKMIRYLRNKVDKGFEPQLIQTRWGEGYMLRADDDPPPKKGK